MDEENTAALAEIIKHVKEYETKLAEKKDCKSLPCRRYNLACNDSNIFNY